MVMNLSLASIVFLPHQGLSTLCCLSSLEWRLAWKRMGFGERFPLRCKVATKVTDVGPVRSIIERSIAATEEEEAPTYVYGGPLWT